MIFCFRRLEALLDNDNIRAKKRPDQEVVPGLQRNDASAGESSTVDCKEQLDKRHAARNEMVDHASNPSAGADTSKLPI